MELLLEHLFKLKIRLAIEKIKKGIELINIIEHQTLSKYVNIHIFFC